MKKAVFSIFSILILIFVSCTPEIKIQVLDSSLVNLDFSTSLDTSVEPQIRKLIGLDNDLDLFEKEAIEQSLKKSNFHIDEIKLPRSSSVVIVSQNQNISQDINPLSKLIIMEEKENSQSCKIIFNPQNIQKLIQGMPINVQEYSELLMAPSLTGEIMDEEEYLNLFALVYGPILTKAFQNSKFLIELQTPKAITKSFVSNKNIAEFSTHNNTANISLSLYKVLALSQNNPMYIQIEWSK